MQASFAEALTCCPACKKEVPIADTQCRHCYARADTTSSFLNFRRPDGSKGMVDQLTAAFLRSQNSQPVQADLDQLFARSTRIQIMELVFEGRNGRFQPCLEFTKADDLSALRKCLAIEASTGHAMRMGQLCFEFFHLNDLVARIEIVGTTLLRWSVQWKNDAYLTNPIILAEFLQSHGFAKLREFIDRDAEAESKRIASHAAWVATWKPAIPAGLDTLVEELSNETYVPEPKARPRALALLAAQYASVDGQILALFAWYGHGSGPWSGFPSSEVAPEFMLESFSAEELLHALESQNLTRQQLEGAARFVSRWVSKPRQRAHRDLIDRFRNGRIGQQILTYVQSTEDSSKIEAVVRTLGK